MNSFSDSIPAPLLAGHLHVWRFSLHADAPVLSACARWLSADERQRAERFAFPDLRRRFVVARANLRQLLGGYAGVAPDQLIFSYGPSGKPQLLIEGLHFNLSHSGEQALIAIAADGAVGVDLEMIRPLDYAAVASKILSHADQEMLSRALGDLKADLFFRLWVRHEARVKAAGGGIGSPADLPAYDLALGEQYRGAVATAIKDVQIDMFET